MERYIETKIEAGGTVFAIAVDGGVVPGRDDVRPFNVGEYDPITGDLTDFGWRFGCRSLAVKKCAELALLHIQV